MKKILVGMIVVLMLLLPSVIATADLDSNTSQPLNINEGKPDLIVEKFFVMGRFPWNCYDLYCRIRNIGTKNFSLNGKLTFIWSLKKNIFGLIPIKTIISEKLEYGCQINIKPGGKTDFLLLNMVENGDFTGMYTIECWVNPDLKYEEEIYYNNRNKALFLSFGLIQLFSRNLLF